MSKIIIFFTLITNIYAYNKTHIELKNGVYVKTRETLIPQCPKKIIYEQRSTLINNQIKITYKKYCLKKNILFVEEQEKLIK